MMPARDGEPTSEPPANIDALAVGNPGSRCPMALPIHCLKDREQVQNGSDVVSWRHPDFGKTVHPVDDRRMLCHRSLHNTNGHYVQCPFLIW